MSKENIVRFTADEILRKLAAGESKTDWARVDAMTDADIEAAMRDDPNWKDFLNVDWSNAVIVYPQPKSAISIRLDKDVVDFFKATGKGYQTRINGILRHYMQEVTKRRKTGSD